MIGASSKENFEEVYTSDQMEEKTKKESARSAITLTEDFSRGFSAFCDTFDNDRLCGEDPNKETTKDGNFEIKQIELWSFM